MSDDVFIRMNDGWFVCPSLFFRGEVCFWFGFFYLDVLKKAELQNCRVGIGLVIEGNCSSTR